MPTTRSALAIATATLFFAASLAATAAQANSAPHPPRPAFPHPGPSTSGPYRHHVKVCYWAPLPGGLHYTCTWV